MDADVQPSAEGAVRHSHHGMWHEIAFEALGTASSNSSKSTIAPRIDW